MLSWRLRTSGNQARSCCAMKRHCAPYTRNFARVVQIEEEKGALQSVSRALNVGRLQVSVCNRTYMYLLRLGLTDICHSAEEEPKEVSS